VQEIDKPYVYANMSVPRALKLFPVPTAKAIKSEVISLLANDTFEVVDRNSLTPTQAGKILRSIMNITEKFLPTLDANGNREPDCKRLNAADAAHASAADADANPNRDSDTSMGEHPRTPRSSHSIRRIAKACYLPHD
jgi:hypothetical protein